MERFLICLMALCLSPLALAVVVPASVPSAGPRDPPADPPPRPEEAPEPEAEEPPEGYYAFVESPNATPPRVRPPPYRIVSSECPPGVAGGSGAHVSAANLCGDLNRGLIPRNPLGHHHHNQGEPYPFELIRNHTLRFLSKTLPVLRADDTLPRVALLAPSHAPPSHSHYASEDALQNNRLERRARRSAPAPPPAPAAALPMEHREEGRDSHKFCDGGGVFCMLYRAINGDGGAAVERREDPGPPPGPAGPHPAHPHAAHPRYEGPPTPCPARVEYATPVFARNYQGVWRYVVQIPYEGYFTQTVEVTRCMQSRCHYLEGGCLSSPRWVSLLVAEMHYPQPQSPQQQQQQQQYQAAQAQYLRRSDDPDPAAASAGAQADPDPHYRHKREADKGHETHTQTQDTHPVQDRQTVEVSQGRSEDRERRAVEVEQARAQFGSAEGEGERDGGEKAPHCDGHDELGCYQVRLYYDWFLVPGSCKCWRPDYFARYVRRRQTSPDL